MSIIRCSINFISINAYLLTYFFNVGGALPHAKDPFFIEIAAMNTWEHTNFISKILRVYRIIWMRGETIWLFNILRGLLTDKIIFKATTNNKIT